MIKISIIESPDQDIKGEHLLFTDFISIGNTSNDRILLDESGAKNKKFRICLKIYSKDKIAVWILPRVDFYKSNCKKIAGTKLHKKNGIIEYMDMKIEILDFHFVKSKIKNDPIMEAISNKLTKELEMEFLYLEENSHATK